MNMIETLKLIQQLSGLSQEKLAQRLKVSFPTFNSWINGKSVPRWKSQEEVRRLLNEYTGTQKSHPDPLVFKKDIIFSKVAQHKNILKKIRENPDVYDQFMLSLTYNTNRIEGSTLSEAETAAILFQNAALSNKSIIEQLEVKNHQAALERLFTYCAQTKRIEEAFILQLHGMLMNGIRPDAGSYRQHAVRIVGANIPTANYLKVPKLMHELVADINRASRDVITHAALIHSRFEQIHPFSDGNGRIGRLLIHGMLLLNNIVPAVIRQEKKRFYIAHLQKSQKDNDFGGLEGFLCDAILEGFKISERK